MSNINQLNLLNHQWKDFIHRLHLLNHLSSQYERIHWNRIDSRLSNLNHDHQQELLTDDKIDQTIQLNGNINKRLDVIRHDIDDIQLFLNSIHQWKNKTLENL